MNDFLIQKIILEPHELLHKPCEKVYDFLEARKIAQELLQVIKSASQWWNRCLGFAANQIGYSKRIIVLRMGKNYYEILINPILVEKKFSFPYIETCYSLNREKYYLVKRYLWAKVIYQDLHGVRCEQIVRGPSAVYQEIDHLNGILVSEIGWRVF